MALSISFVPDGEGQVGRMRVMTADVTFDSSYPAGGYPISGHDAGVGTLVMAVLPVGSNAVGIVYTVDFDPTLGTLRFGDPNLGTTSYAAALAGSTNLAGTEGNADQAAAPVNSGYVFTGDTIANVAGVITPDGANPDVPRNIVVTLENGTLGALDLFEGTTIFTVIGTGPDDDPLSEAVELTSTALNKEVATTKFRFFQGTKVFKTVTSVTITNPPADDFTVTVGIGSRIWLPEQLRTPAYTDVTSASINLVPLTISGTTGNAGGVDASENAINVGTIANADDLLVNYDITNEVLTGTSLATVVKRLQFYGQ